MGVRSLYGKVAINKEYCPDCHVMAFVLDNCLQCCERPHEADPTKWKRESVCGLGKRPQISRRMREEIIASQNALCLYCGQSFGTRLLRVHRRSSQTIILKVVIDHMVPWQYTGNHSYNNLAAACHVCNQIKASLMFASVDEARVYIAIQKERKGYL